MYIRIKHHPTQYLCQENETGERIRHGERPHHLLVQYVELAKSSILVAHSLDLALGAKFAFRPMSADKISLRPEVEA
jgi:hypothetical protein